MRPLRRRISKIIPASLLLCVTAAWLLGRHQPRAILFPTIGGHWLVVANGNRGVLLCEGKVNLDGVVSPAGELQSFAVLSVTHADFQNFVDALLGQSSKRIGRLGINVATGPNAVPAIPSIDSFAMLTLPYWLMSLFPAALVALQIRRRLIRRRRKRNGLCPTCGYDLRMNEGRCPECGSARL